MNPLSSLPSYTELTLLLNKIQPDLHPAETHGLLCGYLCITPNPKKLDPEFEQLLLRGKADKKIHVILSQLYEASYHSLNQFSFEFSLIIPDDDTDINIRAEALGLWCQGFLTGLAQSSTPLQNYPENEITEALSDFSEIAQINFSDIPANEEDETAYFELVEYVRLTALMFFNELQSNSAPQKIGEKTLLH